MCDYSLHNVASRSAKIGDRLVSTRFPNSITGGFASVDEPNVAVCLLPGTELAFEENVAHERTYGLIFPRSEVVISGQNVARFRQVNLDQPHAHHDALEFPDGQVVLVTILREGQRATVIQMPAKPHPKRSAPTRRKKSSRFRGRWASDRDRRRADVTPGARRSRPEKRWRARHRKSNRNSLREQIRIQSSRYRPRR